MDSISVDSGLGMAAGGWLPGWGSRSLARAAFCGDEQSVLEAAVRVVGSLVPATSVLVGAVRGEDIGVAVWRIEGVDADLSGHVTLPRSCPHPMAAAVRSGMVVRGNGEVLEFPEVEVAVPVPGEGSFLGVIGVGVRAEAWVSEQALEELAASVGLAWQHARTRGKARQVLQETVTVLAAVIEGRDEYTESHCIHLSETALALGLRMGLDADSLDRLTFGGILHDIGKVAVPDAILTKPGPLTDVEYAEMQLHASVGEGILSRIGFLAEVAPVVGQHHERVDGSGYPRGLVGADILLEARILAVVDAFDAMTTARPYRAALPWSRAVEEIRSCSDSQFDPDVVDVFLRYMEGEEAQWNLST